MFIYIYICLHNVQLHIHIKVCTLTTYVQWQVDTCYMMHLHALCRRHRSEAMSSTSCSRVPVCRYTRPQSNALSERVRSWLGHAQGCARAMPLFGVPPLDANHTGQDQYRNSKHAYPRPGRFFRNKSTLVLTIGPSHRSQIPQPSTSVSCMYSDTPSGLKLHGYRQVIVARPRGCVVKLSYMFDLSDDRYHGESHRSCFL